MIVLMHPPPSFLAPQPAASPRKSLLISSDLFRVYLFAAFAPSRGASSIVHREDAKIATTLRYEGTARKWRMTISGYRSVDSALGRGPLGRAGVDGYFNAAILLPPQFGLIRGDRLGFAQAAGGDSRATDTL